jgi:predicted heme/steroid binding protein
MRQFTEQELSRFDGKEERPAYVACNGKVYDVSGSFLWQKGNHQALHRAGSDLTGALKQAPHGEDLLERFPAVGNLASDQLTGKGD